MDKSVSFQIDEDVYEKFYLALALTGDTREAALENCMRGYIAKAFEKASQVYRPGEVMKQSVDENKDFSGKAIQRIPGWALKANQYNHKIIRAYFTSVDIAGNATIDMMERLCSDKEQPKLYVPTFRSNYSQMKMDGLRSHGKVFEDDGKNVWIWKEIEETLMKYKASFFSGEE